MDFPSTPNPNFTGAPATPTPTPVAPTTPPAYIPPAMNMAAPVQIPVQSHAGSAGEDQVYTMPDKFIQAGSAGVTQPKKSHKALTWILIIVIILAVLAIAGGVAFYLLRAKQPTTTATTTTTVTTNTTNTTTNVTTANTNAAANANVNASANSNVTANANVNSNANVVVPVTNVNAANTNTVNANTNTTTNTTTTNTNVSTDSFTNTSTITVPSSKDTDQDQLTNSEEQVWGTKADLPDTDSDGYSDGVEVIAGYDPTAPGSARLDVGTLVATYSNKEFNYTMWYPTAWVAQSLSQGDSSEVLFTPNSLDTAGQFMEVIVQTNPTGYTALDWYAQQTGLPDSQLVTFTTFAGETGVWSLDGNTAYFANNNHIYAVSYRYGTSKELYFKATFTLMAKSFVLTNSAQVTANTNTATNTTTNANTNTSNTNSNVNAN